MPSSEDAMNAAIRAGARPAPPDLNDHQAVNQAIRQAAGIPPPTPRIGLPPGPDANPRDFNAWADAATDAGMPPDEVARWGGWWVEAHRQVLADRRALR
jgi:hypothetical protein